MTDRLKPDWLRATDVPLDLDGPTVEFVPFDLRSGPEAAVLDLVAAQAERTPDHAAIIDDQRSVSYRELIAEACALGAAIAAVASPGQAVGIRLPDCAEGPIAFLACLFAATPAVLMDNADPPERTARLAAESQLAALITVTPQPGLICISPVGGPPASLADRRALDQGGACVHRPDLRQHRPAERDRSQPAQRSISGGLAGLQRASEFNGSLSVT